jgi:predicted amidohydrolase
VDLDGSRAAVAICADTGRPSHARAAAERGATIYLASMFVIPSDFEMDSSRLAGHATRHSMAVVMSNYGGATGGLAAAGRSSIWSERGELIARLPDSGAGIALARESEGRWSGETIAFERGGVRSAGP